MNCWDARKMENEIAKGLFQEYLLATQRMTTRKRKQQETSSFQIERWVDTVDLGSTTDFIHWRLLFYVSVYLSKDWVTIIKQRINSYMMLSNTTKHGQYFDCIYCNIVYCVTYFKSMFFQFAGQFEPCRNFKISVQWFNGAVIVNITPERGEVGPIIILCRKTTLSLEPKISRT